MSWEPTLIVRVSAGLVAAWALLLWILLTNQVAVLKSRLLEESVAPDQPPFAELATRGQRSAFIARWSQQRAAHARLIWSAVMGRALAIAVALALMAALIDQPWSRAALFGLALPACWIAWARGQRSRVLAGIENERQRLLSALTAPS